MTDGTSMTKLREALQQTLHGEVLFDPYSRVLYSTDASIYSIPPLGVVVPRVREDVAATMRIAAEHGAPLLPRGGGTSLAGQTVGAAIQIDFSKYLNRLLEVNTEEHWVRVEPGVVLDELNAALAGYGLMFGPDVATSNRATLGGMIGNNSAGAHSILYGLTRDHVLELTVLLADGTELVTRPLTPSEQANKIQTPGREGQIYREVSRIITAHHDEILARFPKLKRRVSGYNLDAFAWDQPFDLSQLIIGSEGTLGVVVEAKLNLVPRPRQKALAIVHFADFLESLAATQEILKVGPASVELLDRMLLDFARTAGEYARRRTFVEGEPEALLLVEFYGDSPAELVGKLEHLEQHRRDTGFGYAVRRAVDPAEQADVWAVRKAGVGLLMGMKGDRKPVSFVEDTAVPVEHLPAFIERFRAIVADHGTTASMYAHASVGCLHVRPVLNLKDPADIARMRSIAEQVSDLVAEFGGAMSGEHGDGLARSEWLEKQFGPQLCQAFKEIKQAFDPQGLMNPGKIVDPLRMDENLRYGPNYRTPPLQTHFRFAQEGGFAAAVELCNGAGVCRKRLEGTMCPSFMVTGDEKHSTRGRANVLRAVLSGALPFEDFTSRELYDVLDLCLECKACQAECPSNVDLAKLKSEFLAHYHAAHGTPLRAWFFAHAETLSRLGCQLAPFSNGFLRTRLARQLLALLGIDSRRELPPFAETTFLEWFKNRKPKTENRKPKGATDWEGSADSIKSNLSSNFQLPTSNFRKVVLFHDTFLTYHEPHIGQAAVELLEAAGFEVILPEKKCCGRPMISKGLLKAARKNALFNVRSLAKYAEQGLPIVGCEPSCISAIRDDYLDLVDDPRAELVAAHTYLIDEFLAKLHQEGQLNLRFSEAPREVLFHGHCHQKALIGSQPSLAALRLPPGFRVREVDSGCCGLAGSFGFEKEHYDLSLALAERRLFPAIRALPDEAEVVACGTSCRQQIAHGTGRRAKHVVEVLREVLEEGG